jgi:enolase-phosphatase E1
MVAHLYDDVAPALKRWKEAGIDLRIYSSGSVQAQKLFFGHTVAGDLLPLLTRHYDRSVGAKDERISYSTIASDYGVPGNRILFVSDVVPELDAANEARMQVALSIRPGNQPVDDNTSYPGIESFDELDKLFRLS